MRYLMAMVFMLCLVGQAHAQELVHFPSLDGPPATQLDGYLWRAPGPGRSPAIVLLHGCSGMFTKSGKIYSRDRDWAMRFTSMGMSVLEVDSFGPRHHGQMCSPRTFSPSLYAARAFDAYAALRYLQSQNFVEPDRIGLLGWSQGGGTVLNTIRTSSRARPTSLPDGDFRAAVAFYPASCRKRVQGAVWSSSVPLLVLIGADDVWTPLPPCLALMNSPAPNTKVTMKIYPGAYHDFDWPNLPVHQIPAFRTKKGVIPIEGTNNAARADALQRVPAFFASYLR
ncbi:dienelactone hydrolase family protein [Acidocella sp.]|uniref:dienelactone hydrolase family protein n=1 Tax=Acidocella sp. TaxID=50710 RepID=UPI002F3F9597